jgi:hypothetical protein
VNNNNNIIILPAAKFHCHLLSPYLKCVIEIQRELCTLYGLNAMIEGNVTTVVYNIQRLAKKCSQ